MRVRTFCSLVFLISATFLAAGGCSPSAKKGEEGAPHFLHCPTCQFEIPYAESLDGKVCTHCGKGHFHATVRSIQDGGLEEEGSPLMRGFIVFVVIATVGQAIFFAWYLKKRRKKEAQTTTFLKCLCPHCSRKIAYPENAVGKGMQCAQCKTAFILPALGDGAVVRS